MLKALDAWFSQSTMDVCFRWMEAFPGFRVYLFSVITLFNEGKDIDYWSPSSFHNGPPTIKVIVSGE